MESYFIWWQLISQVYSPFYIVLSLFCHLSHEHLLNMSFKIAARKILANYCYVSGWIKKYSYIIKIVYDGWQKIIADSNPQLSTTVIFSANFLMWFQSVATRQCSEIFSEDAFWYKFATLLFWCHTLCLSTLHASL